MTIDEINKKIKNLDSNLISDGYHTFGELYEHRITLWITVCRLVDRYDMLQYNGKKKCWRSELNSEGEKWDGWFLLGLYQNIDGFGITYHLPMSKWDDCDFAEELEKAPKFDGHTSEDVLGRLRNL